MKSSIHAMFHILFFTHHILHTSLSLQPANELKSIIFKQLTITTMKGLQLLTLAILGASAMALPEPSKMLNQRQTFTCTAGKFPQCCENYAAGVGTQPTGIGLGCTPQPEGGACGAQKTRACCMITVSGLTLNLGELEKAGG